MCAKNSFPKNKINTFILYLIAIMLGLISGLSGLAPLQSTGLVISDIFIKVFKCISLPIIALSIIVTLSHQEDGAEIKRIGPKIFFYTLMTTAIAAGVAFLLYLLISPGNVLVTLSQEASKVPASSGQIKYLDHLVQLIPTNIFSPFLEHQVLSVLLVSAVAGIAVRYIPGLEARNTVTQFFKGAHGIFLVLTNWIVKMIPLALYGFITSLVMQVKSGINLNGLGQYLTVIVLSNIIQGSLILPLFLFANNIKPFKAFRAMSPALSVAFFSKSSVGTLPVTMETIENRLGVSSRISRLVLPLCTSINMNGCAAFIFTTVIFLMQNHGLETSMFTMLLWVFIATIAAIGNAGVPMGCFFLSASLLTSMDIPITLLGLILPFYSIIDMFETALNVWSDSCVTKVIHEKEVKETEQVSEF